MESLELVSLLADAGHNAERYSGRGMFGRSCVAVISDEKNAFEVIADLVEVLNPDDMVLYRDVVQLIRTTRTDSMGKGIIVYWPEIEWVDFEER